MTATTTALDTVPVTGDGLRAGYRGHIIAVDGLTATVTSIDKKDNGERVIHWVQIDCDIDAEPKTGTIYLPDGATVDCVRVSDWINRDATEAGR